MLKAFKKAERGPFRRLSDNEILLFVARTLKSRGAEPEAPDVFSKLRSLKDVLDQQEIGLLDWPDSPGKDRFYASHMRAKALIAHILDYFGDVAAVDDVTADGKSG